MVFIITPASTVFCRLRPGSLTRMMKRSRKRCFALFLHRRSPSQLPFSKRTVSTPVPSCKQKLDQPYKGLGYRRVRQHPKPQRTRRDVEHYYRRRISFFLMYKTMNHPSEWAKFFDEHTGRYRYRRKGSGVVRDTLISIGKALNRRYKSGKKGCKRQGRKSGQKIK